MGVRINKLGGAEQVVRYYTKQGMEAYYSQNQEFNGFWLGKGAAMLGLKGQITEEAFRKLANNLHPITGKKLTPRMREDRRSGFDITFDVPKSVSLAYAYSGDDRIVQAVRQAAADSLREKEYAAATRVRAGMGKDSDGNRTTGNYVAAEIIHLTARPEDGFPDPHLHIHMVVFNLTFDPVEEKWKALQMLPVHQEMKYYQGAFHMRLRENLEKLGLNTVLTRHGFEIEGMPKELNDIFSRRTRKIEETAERLGITDPVQKAKLGALTRGRKDKSLTMDELRPLWWGGLSPEHEAALKAVAATLKRSQVEDLSRQMVPETPAPVVGKVEQKPSSEWLGSRPEAVILQPSPLLGQNRRSQPTQGMDMNYLGVTPTKHDRRAVALAMRHIFERNSVATEMELLAEAFDGWCVGRATRLGIMRVVREEASLRWLQTDGRTYVTTPEVIAEEKRLYESCKAGKGQYDPLNFFWEFEDQTLSEQQRKAVRHVLDSRDWVVGISGKAGAGKTRLMCELRRGIESRMYKIIALAPTAKAARENLRNEGFQNAETVAKLLVNKELQKEAEGAVLLVDEAGLLSNRQADQLFELAKRIGARLVLIGDTGQHHAVERGQAFDLLERKGEMSTVAVTEILRQKGNYKRFIELVSEGRIEEAFAVEGVMNHVKELETPERKETLADDYLDAVARKKKALVIAPTHKECDALAETIREKLKAKGALGEARQWDTLRNLGWTEAQRSDEDQYRAGLVVQFNGHVKGFALGERVEVIGVRDGVVRVRCDSQYHPGIKGLPLESAKQFNVYEPTKLEVCAGEGIRVTTNCFTKDGHRLTNGNEYKLDYFDKDGRMVLENGWRMDKEFVHFEYSYTSTSNAAQGMTVDAVFLSQSARSWSSATDLNQFYVSMSRGREEFTLYTDDFDLLKEQVKCVRQRPMATDLVAEGEKVPEMVRHGTSRGLGEFEAQQMAMREEIERIMRENLERERRVQKSKSMVMGL